MSNITLNSNVDIDSEPSTEFSTPNPLQEFLSNDSVSEKENNDATPSLTTNTCVNTSSNNNNNTTNNTSGSSATNTTTHTTGGSRPFAVRTTPRKRRLESTENERVMNRDSPPRKRKRETSGKKKPKKSYKPVEAVKIEEFECVVCQELPREIYQCSNGHVVCLSCHKRIADSKKPECPICRVQLDARHPSRNRLAERYLSTVLMPCDNDDCPMEVPFLYLQQHVNHECEYRNVGCKYSPLGCEWKGLAKDQKPHSKQCAIKKMEAKSILKKVQKLNEKKAEADSKMKTDMSRYDTMLSLLESRARNIQVRDVLFDGGQTGETVSSHLFKALRTKWYLDLQTVKNADDTSTVQFRIRNVSVNLRHRLPVKVILLKGPDLGYKIGRTMLDCEITRKKPTSEWIDTKIPAEALQVSSQDTINLRAVWIDKRPGMSMGFREERDDDYDSEQSPSTFYSSDDDMTGDDGDGGESTDRSATLDDYSEDDDDVW